MTVAELITELQKLDPAIKVCGESETNRWEIEAEDITPEDGELVLGYSHG